jgi:protein TonB
MLLMTAGGFAIDPVRTVPLVMTMIPLEREPPPLPPSLPDVPAPEVPEPRPQQIVAPPPIERSPAPAPTMTIIATPPPPAPPVAVIAEPRPRTPSDAPVSSDNLALKLISATPPRYPVASRRAREQGVVLLDVLLGEDGSVDDISVKRSSGHDRLDDAARLVVRRWRWSPTIVDGKAVRVRGIVRIPFELRG